ncbi:MAG: hypothetical protein NC218_11325 [Acetobacter sp.]|nr:hypothetical protein [Acetobacter sp.]
MIFNERATESVDCHVANAPRNDGEGDPLTAVSQPRDDREKVRDDGKEGGILRLKIKK